VKRKCGSFLVFCILLRLEDAGIIGAGHETLHQRCGLGVNEEDLVERVSEVSCPVKILF
jgi:hypothetical protein